MSYAPNPTELKDAFEDLVRFFRNPVDFLKTDPNWSWSTIIFVTLIFSSIIGAISGIIGLKLGSIVRGALIYPLSSLFIISVFTVFFEYTLLFFFRKEAPRKKLFNLCFLASLPWIIVAPLVDYVPPLSPVGIILSGMLAVVALSENFHVDKKAATRLMLGIVGIFLIFWLWNLINFARFESADSDLITPESLDIIEKELNN